MSILSIKGLSIRTNAANPDHHLFNNHGTWWIHCTLHLRDHTKSRLRGSLGTSDLSKARERRDDALAHLQLHARMGPQADHVARGGLEAYSSNFPLSMRTPGEVFPAHEGRMYSTQAPPGTLIELVS